MEPADSKETNLRIIDVLAIILFLGQVVGWIVGAGFVFQAFSVVAGPNPGDALIGVIVIAMYATGIGFGAAIVSIPLAIMARQTPAWIRYSLVLLPAAAVAIGAVLFFLS